MTANTVRMAIESDSTPSRHIPTPFEIASIAAQLSNGKNPEKHLRAAIQLYWRADYSIKKIEEELEDFEMQEAFDKEQSRYLLLTKNGPDTLRQYLEEKGLRLKKPETVHKNLRSFLNETGRAKEVIALKADLKKLGCAKILITTVDEFVSFKKKRKSEGGKRSHRARQNGPASATTAKK